MYKFQQLKYEYLDAESKKPANKNHCIDQLKFSVDFSIEISIWICQIASSDSWNNEMIQWAEWKIELLPTNIWVKSNEKRLYVFNCY